jgi:hypothetical protein
VSWRHNHRHNARRATLGKDWTNSRAALAIRVLPHPEVQRAMLATAQLEYAFREVGRVMVRVKANFDAFAAELRRTLEARR